MGSAVRPFDSVESMHRKLLHAVKILDKNDTLIHLGDFACIDKDRQWTGIDRKTVNGIIDSMNFNIVFIEGNHDLNNLGFSTGKVLIDHVGGYLVTMQHYPSNHPNYMNTGVFTGICFKNRNIRINICGHVHSEWKVMFDFSNDVLNINVGIDMNNFKLYSEQDLSMLIGNALTYVRYLETVDDPETCSYKKWWAKQSRRKADKRLCKKIRSAIWKAEHKPELLTDYDRQLLLNTDIKIDNRGNSL